MCWKACQRRACIRILFTKVALRPRTNERILRDLVHLMSSVYSALGSCFGQAVPGATALCLGLGALGAFALAWLACTWPLVLQERREARCTCLRRLVWRRTSRTGRISKLQELQELQDPEYLQKLDLMQRIMSKVTDLFHRVFDLAMLLAQPSVLPLRTGRSAGICNRKPLHSVLKQRVPLFSCLFFHFRTLSALFHLVSRVSLPCSAPDLSE